MNQLNSDVYAKLQSIRAHDTSESEPIENAALAKVVGIFFVYLSPSSVLSYSTSPASLTKFKKASFFLFATSPCPSDIQKSANPSSWKNKSIQFLRIPKLKYRSMPFIFFSPPTLLRIELYRKQCS